MHEVYTELISEVIDKEKSKLQRIVEDKADLSSPEAIQQSWVLDDLVVAVMREQLKKLQDKNKGPSN